jgi:hypothetical protein
LRLCRRGAGVASESNGPELGPEAILCPQTVPESARHGSSIYLLHVHLRDASAGNDNSIDESGSCACDTAVISFYGIPMVSSNIVGSRGIACSNLFNFKLPPAGTRHCGDANRQQPRPPRRARENPTAGPVTKWRGGLERRGVLQKRRLCTPPPRDLVDLRRCARKPP